MMPDPDNRCEVSDPWDFRLADTSGRASRPRGHPVDT
jgi:hypothetical protein